METCDLYILKIFAFKMLTVAQKTFSLIFVSKKQKLKISQGGEAPAEGTDAPHLYMIATRSCRWRHRTFLSQSVTSAFEMVPSLRFGKIMRLQTFFPPASLAVRYGYSRKRESIAP